MHVIMFNIFKQYKGLRKELYVLFYGRIVTSLGAMIQPLLTLILSSKLHFDAASIALLLLFFSIAALPATYLSGYLADRINKRNLIIIFDCITVVSYIACGFIPLGTMSIVLIFIGSLFAIMEGPIYDALVADLSDDNSREKAYSLNYLGMNLGFVLAPSIGGLLFENYLHIAFIISGVCTFISTIFIYLMIKDVSRSVSTSNVYENESNESVFSFLKNRKIIAYFIICNTLVNIIYGQSHFLLPLNLEKVHGSELGALLYGTLNSVNALIVTIGTPILTLMSHSIKDISKIFVGLILIVVSYLFFTQEYGIISFYYMSMFVFTLGEIFSSLGTHPYLTRRIPASMRGRISGLYRVFSSLCVALSQNVAGYFIDNYTMTLVWKLTIVVGIIGLVLLILLKQKDKKEYPLLYK